MALNIKESMFTVDVGFLAVAHTQIKKLISILLELGYLIVRWTLLLI